MEVRFILCLPRDELSIPVGRHICRQALKEIGVEEGCSRDIELALTEACANVLVHSGAGHHYELQVVIDDRYCTMRVVDAGQGFDAGDLGRRRPASGTDESGRGIQIMQAIVDKVVFYSRPEAGTIVHLEKELVFTDDSPMKHLGAGG